MLLTDTVGFIQKLPTQLVAAFRATLEEISDAALLLHVVDVSHLGAAAQAETVKSVSTLSGLSLAISQPPPLPLPPASSPAPASGSSL